ncbi:MAG: XisI protein [Chloroflexota bacterium]|nr:XisI protein [Chloroflexota bacterium]
MDANLTNYRQIIQQILANYAALIKRTPEPGQETELVLDEARDHYILHTTGWDKKGRVLETTIYVRLRNGKFWIEVDWTGKGVANDLVTAGVPPEDIVLAFHHSEVRPLTEFAVA